MRDEDVKTAIRAEPFVPIVLRLTGGAELPVRHPDAIAVGPRTTAILVVGAFQIVSNMPIKQIVPQTTAQ